jgi:hypothetical protein
MIALVLAVSGAGYASPPTQPALAAAASASGQAMPVGDLPGWKQVFADDFSTAVPLGAFPGAVGGSWGAYPYPAKDTSRNGVYWPQKVVSQQGGVMDFFIHTEGGMHLVSAPQPRLFPGVSAGRGQLYGRYAVRFRADPLPGYKIAWMLWPDSGVWPRDGEVDFPESNLDSPMCAFMHRLGGGGGADQDAYCTGSTYVDWHTAVIEWTPSSVTFLLDGRVIGRSTNRIPNTPLHWVLQTETALSGAPSDAVAGHVQIDWIAAYRLDPSALPPAPVPIRPAPAAAAASGPAAPAPTSPESIGRGAIIVDRITPNDRELYSGRSTRAASSSRRGTRAAGVGALWPGTPRMLADSVRGSLRILADLGVVELVERGVVLNLALIRDGVERVGDLLRQVSHSLTP